MITINKDYISTYHYGLLEKTTYKFKGFTIFSETNRVQKVEAPKQVNNPIKLDFKEFLGYAQWRDQLGLPKLNNEQLTSVLINKFSY